MDKLKIIGRYLSYLRNAKSKYNVHSPFVYELLTKVFEDKRYYPEYGRIQGVRETLLKNNTPVEVIDFGTGAGNKPYGTYYRKVKEITRRTEQPAKLSRLLFRLVKYFQPADILELGTSMGLGSMHMALANPEARITTIEGCSNVASCARNNMDQLGIENVDIVIGDFDNILSGILDKKNTFDLVFFDGNHRKIPTLNYFKLCLERASNHSVFVFDDIHWSKGMEEAWEEIKRNPKVKVSIDLFYMGLVFFKDELSKQDFILKY